MSTKISVFIITFNEEKIIGKCLEKLHFADEIIVVDSGSTDKTIEICQSFQVKVIINKFENFGVQKQFALNQTKNNWVLSLDADEILSDKLIFELQKFDSNFEGYNIPRTHVFLNKIFKYGSENKKPILRFFNKNHGYFLQNKIHEKIIVNGNIGNFKNEMLHYTVFDIGSAFQKNVSYSILGGHFLFENNKKTSIFKTILKIPYEFLRVYFLHLNILNGYQGFVWSIYCSIGSFLKYAKLYELQNQEINSL